MRREEVVDRLAAAGCVDPEGEAGELLAAAPDDETLAGWLARREDGEPLAWLTGTATFCGRPVRVDPGVYVPRPQTEELARRAAAALPPGGRAVDLCCGSGAVAAHLAAAVEGAAVVGVDVDPVAVACARRNGVTAVVGSAADPPLRPGGFDVVVAVAPYVPTAAIDLLPRDVRRWEPRSALDGGPDGLDVVRSVVSSASRLLRPGGRLLLELGGEQDTALLPALDAAGFARVGPWYDDDGDLRGCEAVAVLDVADRLALHELLHLYGHLVDDRAWDELDQVFTADAVYDASDFGMPVTRSLAELVAEWTSEDGLRRHPLAHHATNIVVREDANGTVRIRSKGIGVGAGGRVGSVVYDDVAVRTDAGWRLASRRVTLRRPPA